MKNKISDKQTEVKINIGLDENNIPERIFWTAPDGGVDNEEAKAMLLSFWNGEKQESLRMDLWVKEMPIDQMNVFFHQTLVTMKDTFLKATQNEKMAATMNDFCEYFAENLNIDRKG